jgi:hypothetical protein
VVNTEYDPTDGHPVSVSIDYMKLAQDDELDFKVKDLQAEQ